MTVDFTTVAELNPFAGLLCPVLDRPGMPGPGREHVPIGRVVRLLRDEHVFEAEPSAESAVRSPEPTVERPRRSRQDEVHNARLLEVLKQAGTAVSCAVIANALSISEGGVPRAVNNLRRTGVVVVSVRNQGYALPDATPIAATPAPSLQRRRVRAGVPAPVVRAEPTYKGPVRAEGEMTYGAAVRLIHKARDGGLVDLDDLERAHWTVAAAREGAPA